MLPLLILNTLVSVALLLLAIFILRSLQKTLADIHSNINKNVETQSERESFVPMLVHELRAPVSVIKGASDLILKDASSLSADQIQSLLSQIRNSSTGLLNMIGSILDVTKMESGRFEVIKVQSNYANMLKEEVAYFEALAKVKNISLSLHIEQNPLLFKFDPERVKQILNNLISNSLKFTPSGGEILVDSRCDKATNSILTIVSDTGSGIPHEERSKLFHKFVQGNNQNHTKEKGTGLGLVIAKGIVEAHGGKIWIEDNIPHGTKFLFTLPYEL